MVIAPVQMRMTQVERNGVVTAYVGHGIMVVTCSHPASPIPTLVTCRLVPQASTTID